jgi:RNA polymerase sigma-70 factor (ECF subfamily)
LYADKHSVDSPTLLLREKRAIERAQAGELAALEPVLAQHAEALFVCLLGRVGERAAAEELLKDTFVTALERIQSFRWQERSIYHWLRQLALHKALDHHRRIGRRKQLCDSLRRELTQPVAGDAASGPSAEAERRLLAQRLDSMLARLPPRYAQALRLRISEERSPAECAAALGVSADSFDLLLVRAVGALRKSYGEPDGGV